MELEHITIVGTGLIGGSLGLALKKRGFRGRVVGCDKPAVLTQAKEMGAIDLCVTELEQAVQGADVVVLATPVGAVLDMIERIGPILPERVLMTDVGSTKREIVDRARAVFGAAAKSRFVAGHPMAGKELGGIEQADANLFEGAAWLVTPMPGQTISTATDAPVQAGGENAARTTDFGDSVVDAWVRWIQYVGAQVVVMDAARHDRLCAWISHLPQFVATALAASLEDEFGGDEELKVIGGRALREMTRVAASPYSMWRDIAFTNTANIEEVLIRMEQRLAHLRENLRTRELQEEFERANQFRKE